MVRSLDIKFRFRFINLIELNASTEILRERERAISFH